MATGEALGSRGNNPDEGDSDHHVVDGVDDDDDAGDDHFDDNDKKVQSTGCIKKNAS